MAVRVKACDCQKVHAKHSKGISHEQITTSSSCEHTEVIQLLWPPGNRSVETTKENGCLIILGFSNVIHVSSTPKDYGNHDDDKCLNLYFAKKPNEVSQI